MVLKCIYKAISCNKILKVGQVRSISSDIRVRFAPSPTGYLHLGGLRTALYNYLFAKSNQGTFILRIEDTDQSRVVPGALEILESDLNWAGILCDEGPSVGGDYGPYIQSKRSNLYRTEVSKLLNNGTAYYCFCTERRLDLLRREALRAGQVPRYDNRCRDLSKLEVEEKLGNGMKKCIRFKLQPGIETFNDLVCGKISLDVASIEGDPVILKSDELPTYHLASVIDDHHMKISHVLRGIEWQSSTTKHIFLYKAFGWQPPQFAHLPLMLNSNGTKLSKRQGDITIEHFRQSGIKPQALVNFITVTGGGFQREPDDKKLIVSHSLEKLSLMFDMKLLVANSSRVNFKRLEDYNRSELIRQISNPKELSSLISELKYLIKDTLEGRIDGSLELDDNFIKGVLLWSQKRIHRLKDLVGPDFSFIWVRPTLQQFEPREPDIFRDLITKLNVIDDCTKEKLNLLLREHAEKHEVPYRIFMKQMRSLLSGLKEGPSVAEMLEILGRKTSVLRIQRAIDYIELNKRAVI